MVKDELRERKNCSDCDYCYPEYDSSGKQVALRCHLNPPQPVQLYGRRDPAFVNPVVAPDYFCSYWTRRT